MRDQFGAPHPAPLPQVVRIVHWLNISQHDIKGE
jgi:hypothetical protein